MLPDGYSDIPAGKIAAVVTCLEMLTPADKRQEPPAHGFSLRRVEKPDPAWYRDVYRRVGEPWLWFSRLRLSEEKLVAIIHDPAVEIHALMSGGGDEGLLELDFRVADECELAFFGVTLDLLGTGAGRYLMNRAIERAWARPITRFWVHTCTLDHPDALAFYVRSGFMPYKRQIEIAADPRLTGDAPQSAAPHVPLL
jgi:GNAT superfamily N-acetyltransferase